MPKLGKFVTAAAVTVGVIGTLAIPDDAPISSPQALAERTGGFASSPDVRRLDEIALAAGEHDRLIVLDAPSQYRELAQMIGRQTTGSGILNRPIGSTRQISAGNHWVSVELPSVRVRSRTGAAPAIETFEEVDVDLVGSQELLGFEDEPETPGTSQRGIFASGVHFQSGLNLTPTMLPGDVMLTGDWNGDGEETDGFFRPVEVSAFAATPGVFFATDGFGHLEQPPIYIEEAAAVTPLVGDWDGDGVDALAIRRSYEHDVFAPDVVEFFDHDGANVMTPLEINPLSVVVVGDESLAVRLIELRNEK